MKKVFAGFFLFILVAFIVSYITQLSEILIALGPKSGRIIDADSGDGIPGVIVVEESWFVEEGLLNRSAGCTSIEMTHTDANGNYHFQDSYYGWEMGFPTRSPHQHFFIHTTKHGYIEATTTWPLIHDSAGSIQTSYEPWSSTNFKLKMKGSEVEIPPIQLRQVEMSLQDEAKYFFFAGLQKYCPNSSASVAPLRDATSDFYEYATDKVCRGNDEDPIAKELVESIAIYSPNDSPVFQAMQDLNKKYRIAPQSKKGFYPRDEACAALRIRRT